MVGISPLELEAIERRALRSLHEVATRADVAQLGLELHEVGGTLLSMARHEPSILLNRAIGCGMEAPASEAEIEQIAALYREKGIGRFFFHLHPDAQPQDKIRGWCASAGLQKYRGWMKFLRGREDIVAAKSDLTIRPIDAREAEAFGRIAGSNFGLSEKGCSLVQGLAEHPGWQLFMSFAGDEPAGTGGLFVDGDIAWTDWGATDPAFRGRGGQSALLAARLRAALEAGCKAIVTETGEAVPDDPQHSYRNILRAGFKESHLRENWVPAF